MENGWKNIFRTPIRMFGPFDFTNKDMEIYMGVCMSYTFIYLFMNKTDCGS